MAEQISSTAADVPWRTTWLPADHDGPDFAPMIAALRMLHDRLTGANAPAELVKEMRREFERISALLAAHQVSEAEQVVGRIDLPGMGQALIPPYIVDFSDNALLRGRVPFGRYYLGRNGAVYGGAIPLFFDAILGRLANSRSDRPPSRTAYLNTSYRSIAPIDTELHFEVRYLRQERRKRFTSGRLLHEETLCAEFDALSIELRPGRP
jgi:hypothetical protein